MRVIISKPPKVHWITCLSKDQQGQTLSKSESLLMQKNSWKEKANHTFYQQVLTIIYKCRHGSNVTCTSQN